MARNVALGSAGILLLLAGCGFDQGRDLQPVVERAMPAHARLLVPCSHTDGLIDYAAYSCTALVEGDGAGTTRAIAAALADAGFELACPSAGSLVATRGNIRVIADVTQWGSLRGAAITAGTWRPVGSEPIPHGSVAFRIDASRLADSARAFYQGLIAKGGRCDRPLPRPNAVSQCVVWWNGSVGTRARAAVPWGTAERAVRIVTYNREGESACTYTIGNGRTFFRLTARFDGDWHWPPLRKRRGRATFRPNARLYPGGRLQALAG